MPIPSVQWVCLQFHPKNPRTKAAVQFRKTIPVKMMIQQRQFRHSHVDAHYCAAIFRYLKEYVLKLRDQALMVCLDNKHRIKVGEPGLPMERGKKVLVSLNQTFEVCDHNFTCFSLIPSVTLLINIPDKIDESCMKVRFMLASKMLYLSHLVVCDTCVSFMMMCFSQEWETGPFSLCT